MGVKGGKTAAAGSHSHVPPTLALPREGWNEKVIVKGKLEFSK